MLKDQRLDTPLQVPIDFGTSPQRRARHAERPNHFRTTGLFAGIGGIELGLQRAGHTTELLCEIDEGARAVLDARFGDVQRAADVTLLRGLPSGTELLAAGFPCQDLSQAGMTRGIQGANSGLVGQIFRLLATRQVPWVLLENVPFMLQLGGGAALNTVLGGLEQLGYRWAYRIVNTQAFGLPHRRRRVYFVASLNGDPREILFADEAGEPPATNPDGVACAFYWTEGLRGLGWAVDAVPTLKGGSTVGIPSPPAVLLPSGEIVKPSIRVAEQLQGFPRNWTLPAEKRVKAGLRWKLVGNAVSVPVATWLGRRFARPGEVVHQGARPLKPGEGWPGAAYNVGQGRYAASISEWPKRYKQRRSLAQYLAPADRQSLSAKATRGFLERTRRSNLRFPPGFIAAVEQHLTRMER